VGVVSAMRRLPLLLLAPLALAIQVPAGTTVTWAFEDGLVPHDVTGDGWRSGDPQRKGTFAHTFDRPGTYPYRCTVHDGMNGRVVVTGA